MCFSMGRSLDFKFARISNAFIILRDRTNILVFKITFKIMNLSVTENSFDFSEKDGEGKARTYKQNEFESYLIRSLTTAFEVFLF